MLSCRQASNQYTVQYTVHCACSQSTGPTAHRAVWWQIRLRATQDRKIAQPRGGPCSPFLHAPRHRVLYPVEREGTCAMLRPRIDACRALEVSTFRCACMIIWRCKWCKSGAEVQKWCKSTEQGVVQVLIFGPSGGAWRLAFGAGIVAWRVSFRRSCGAATGRP